MLPTSVPGAGESVDLTVFRPDPPGVVPGEEGAVMTATLNDQTGRNKRPEPTAEAKAAVELVRAAKEQGLSLTGPDGLLKRGEP